MTNRSSGEPDLQRGVVEIQSRAMLDKRLQRLSDGASRCEDLFELATWEVLQALLDENGPDELLVRSAPPRPPPRADTWCRSPTSRQRATPGHGRVGLHDHALAAGAAAALRNSSASSSGSRSAACLILMQERPMLALGKRSAYRSGRYWPSATALTYSEM
jgi:hypothetical protein